MTTTSPALCAAPPCRVLVWALDCSAGQRLGIAPDGPVIVVTGSRTGPYVVTARGEVSLPAAARAMVGIDSGAPVLVTADPTHDLLVVHAVAMAGPWDLSGCFH